MKKALIRLSDLVKYGKELRFQSEDVMMEVYERMPFVEERKGKWIWVQYDSDPEIGNFHCSECRFIPASYNLAKKYLNFCPNCGAYMRGDEE